MCESCYNGVMYRRHREKRKAAALSYYYDNHEARKARKREWWHEDHEENKRKTREYARTHRSEARKRLQDWRDANRTQARAINNAYSGRKRAARVALVDYEQIVARSKGFCGVCSEPIPEDDIGFDHIVPLSAGGDHAEWNLQLVHRRCNSVKGTALPAEEAQLSLV